ncbi:MAG TPA: hypothetical protein VK470_04475, partial [Bacteroidota bacterium]|nr:hypothetical protein [Bacteroidota bacterium]
AHDQTWDGFSFANGVVSSTGVFVIGGYIDTPALAEPVHHITLRYINIYNMTGRSKTATDVALDHAVYFTWSKGGAHHMLFEYWSVDDRNTGGLATAFVFYHSDPANGILNAHDITVNELTVRGTQEAIYLAESTLSNITFSNVVIKKPLRWAVIIARSGMTNILFQNCVSTGSGEVGFYTDSGLTGITQTNCSWN